MLVIFLIDCCEILMLFFVKDEYYFIFYNLVFMSFFNICMFKFNNKQKNIINNNNKFYLFHL